jgi:hypothetical protein
MTWLQTLAALDDAIGGKLRLTVVTEQEPYTYAAGAHVTTADGATLHFAADTLVQLTERRVTSSTGGTPPSSASVGRAIRGRLIYVGRLFDRVESEEHAAWRLGIVKVLREADAEAQNFDGKPPTPVDESNPLAAKPLVGTRFQTAITKGPQPIPPLLLDLREMIRLLDASGEPTQYGEGFPDDLLLGRIAGGLRPGTLEAVAAIEQDARDWIAFTEKQP